jgi:hypothetical protein
MTDSTGAENLLLGNRHRRRDIAENGQMHEEAILGKRLGAQPQQALELQVAPAVKRDRQKGRSTSLEWPLRGNLSHLCTTISWQLLKFFAI